MVCLSREEQNVDAKTPEKEIVLSTGLNQFLSTGLNQFQRLA
jgi:hypothetical protein